MKNAVIDTSVAIKWFFPESGQNKALDIKQQHLEGKIHLNTRDLFIYEFTSVFRNYSPQKIENKDFKLACSILNAIGIKYYSLEFSELETLFLLSKKLSLSIYDTSYILLAKNLNAKLYTSDKKLYLKAKTVIDAVIV